MKTVFIKALKKPDYNSQKLNDLASVMASLGRIHITYSIQYFHLASLVKKHLECSGVEVNGFVSVLGCRRLSVEPLPILHIGSGLFHATNPNLYRVTNDITLFDGFTITKVDEGLIQLSEKKRKGKLSRYFSADTLGFLVSNKYGQQDLKGAIKFIKDNPKRKSYLFLTNNINKGEFENFNIDFWINTACPRIEEDSSEIISLDRITKMKDLE